MNKKLKLQMWQMRRAMSKNISLIKLRNVFQERQHFGKRLMKCCIINQQKLQSQKQSFYLNIPFQLFLISEQIHFFTNVNVKELQNIQLNLFNQKVILLAICFQYYRLLNEFQSVKFWELSSISMGCGQSSELDVKDNTFKRFIKQQITQFDQVKFREQQDRLNNFSLDFSIFDEVLNVSGEIDYRLGITEKPRKPQNLTQPQSLIWYWNSLKYLNGRIRSLYLYPSHRLEWPINKLFSYTIEPTKSILKQRQSREEYENQIKFLKEDLDRINTEKVNIEVNYQEKLQKARCELKNAEEKIEKYQLQIDHLKKQTIKSQQQSTKSQIIYVPVSQVQDLKKQCQNLRKTIQDHEKKFGDREQYLLLELYELKSVKSQLNEVEYELFDTKREFQRYKDDMKYEIRYRQSIINHFQADLLEKEEQFSLNITQKRQKLAELEKKNNTLHHELNGLKVKTDEQLKVAHQEKSKTILENRDLKLKIEELVLQISVLPGSSIIVTPENRNTVAQYFQPHKIISSTLLYRASHHKFELFTDYCEGCKDILVVIKTQNGICGGYSSQALHKEPVKEDKDNSFLFNLFPKDKIPIKKELHAMKLDYAHGPVFGNKELEVIGREMNVSPKEIEGSFDWAQLTGNEGSLLTVATTLEVLDYEVYQLNFTK